MPVTFLVLFFIFVNRSSINLWSNKKSFRFLLSCTEFWYNYVSNHWDEYRVKRGQKLYEILHFQSFGVMSYHEMPVCYSMPQKHVVYLLKKLSIDIEMQFQ